MLQHTLARPSALVPLVLFAVLALVPFIAQAIGEPFYIALFARIIIYAIAASALNLVLGYGGLVSFGHALFFGIGAYGVALPVFHGIDNGWVHLILVFGVCGVAAAVTGAISLRTSGIAFIMITLAFAQMGFFLFVSLKRYGGDDGLSIAQASRFGPLNLGDTGAVYACAFLVLALATWCLAQLRAAPFGMVLRAARQNPRRVATVGLPVSQYRLTAYVMSGMLCGLAGFLLANLNAFASPSTMAWTVSGELIVIVVLGGMGTVFGPLLGAFVLLGLEEIIKGYTDHSMVVLGPMILLIALADKTGIIGLLQKLDHAAARPAPAPAKPTRATHANGGEG